MTTNPPIRSCTVRPTGAGVARTTGCETATSWFAFGSHAGTATTTHRCHHATLPAKGYVAAKGYRAYKAIATYPHRRPGEDAPL